MLPKGEGAAQMDRITEAIAHFIGLFATIVEEARQRESYDAFTAAPSDNPEAPDLPVLSPDFFTSYEFLGYDPALVYKAPLPDWVSFHPWTFAGFEPPRIPEGELSRIVNTGYLPEFAASGVSHRILPEIETLGSVANYLHQGISLSDNDYFGVGGHGLFFAASPISDAQLIALAGLAGRLSPIGELEIAGTAQELATFVTTASQLLQDTPEAPPEEMAAGTELTVEKSTTLEGTFLDGAKVEEAPKLEDHFTLEEEEEEETQESLPTSTTLSESGADIDVSVKVDTGGNTIVNNAVLQNLWTGSTVTAVMGQHIELNAAIQINAWSDNDQLSPALGGWWHDTAPSQAFNIATFDRFDTSDGSQSGQPAGAFPQHWVIKEVSGDLMIVNWLQQFTYMTDNDVGILSSSGVTTRVSSGDNFAFNEVSIYELGFAYDLIIVGGNVYDANIIHQLNVLIDDDLVGTVSGFDTTGQGSISTSGNLLWNEAYIYNVGGADRFDPLPSHYRETGEKLAGGDQELSDGVLSDPAFAGFGPLRVLHITGDLINVQYVKQTTMLGDSDQVALAMHATDPHPEADWSVSTGGNALLNNAAIMDLDSLGKTYVGEGHYSNEILIQANIISTDPEVGFQDPDALVSEAVVFLDDDLQDAEEADYGYAGNFDPDHGHADGLQTMIG